MSREELSPINAARTEHLRLALPGWGAPSPRFASVVKLTRVTSATDSRKAIERALRAESDLTLGAITIRDVAEKYRVPYSRARSAVLRVRAERGIATPHGGLRRCA